MFSFSAIIALENSRRNPTRIMTEEGEVRINQGSMLFWVGSFPHCGAKYEQENSRIFLSVQSSILKEIGENSIEILEHGETRLLYNSPFGRRRIKYSKDEDRRKIDHWTKLESESRSQKIDQKRTNNKSKGKKISKG